MQTNQQPTTDMRPNNTQPVAQKFKVKVVAVDEIQARATRHRSAEADLLLLLLLPSNTFGPHAFLPDETRLCITHMRHE